MGHEEIEVRLLLEAIYLKYGYDFRNYAKASIKRRINQRMVLSKLDNISAMQHHLLSNRAFFELLLHDFSIQVTEMFRDPSFYLAIRKQVVPVLRTYPYIKIWHAGCASGEEVYSMAILLKEEGLLDKTLIYGTDINEVVLKKAKDGIYPVDKIKEFTQNYHKAGGTKSFSDYYTAKYNAVIMNKELKKNIIFAQHNLATDNDFGEMNLIMCRNVLIYFDDSLENRVFGLFNNSLVRQGFLCLGSKESMTYSDSYKNFEEFVPKEKIYRKIII
ncbi:MAG: protein-glutamate O-methyltransferase CheR [Calditrichaceae bacterium]|nr:protein-glutamate O-methyltransferase CheR [Calditrichaceae bacterium]